MLITLLEVNGSY